jgi:hypothetical protein
MSTAAVDSMIVDYLVHAMEIGYNPSADPDQVLATERVAAFRLFLWNDLTVLPTVLSQLAATRDPTWRYRLEQLVLIHLPEAQIPARAMPALEARATVLAAHHRDDLDCRIVAEAEWIQAASLVSFDHRLRKRLGNHTALPLVTPSEYWEQLAIPRGMPPRWAPAPSNPMSLETWWHW